ncbi:serine/threonine-protein kinase [Nonomuraea typhae]|uniref:serine/threonine-protein kinase n=1 Tax=Nonomuraea typhae TaxID=2603600 RepID=UPI0012F72899|nr:serine/threonine-protein kinase [Nonomuraea typhae]
MLQPLQPGDPERIGRHTLTGRLGEGGQGVVYLGSGPGGEQVAVKVLRAPVAADDGARERFVRELGFAERVADFCTARVLEADVAGGRPYIVSEFVPGPSLQQLVRAEGPRSGAALHRLAIGTATALAAIHQAKVVHRDFKPGNVLMSGDGPRVIDFGIAKALDGTATLTSHVVGTPAYMAPEQYLGEGLGPWTDMFAWGATVLFAATGRAPFGDDTAPAVMHRVLRAEPDVSVLPEPLGGLVAACLAKDPARRPGAAQVLLALLGLDPAAAGSSPEAVLAAGATAVDVPEEQVEAPGTAPLYVPGTAPLHAAGTAPLHAPGGPGGMPHPAVGGPYPPGVAVMPPAAAAKPTGQVKVLLGVGVAALVVLGLLGVVVWRVAAGGASLAALPGATTEPPATAGSGESSSPEPSSTATPTPSPSADLSSLPDPCDMIPEDVAAAFQLDGGGTRTDDDGARRRCSWWPENENDLPYSFADTFVYPTKQPKERTNRPIKINGRPFKERIFRIPGETHKLNCSISWTTSYGYVRVVLSNYGPKWAKAPAVCAAARRLAVKVYPHVKR